MGPILLQPCKFYIISYNHLHSTSSASETCHYCKTDIMVTARWGFATFGTMVRYCFPLTWKRGPYSNGL